jgi:hypothetical protein
MENEEVLHETERYKTGMLDLRSFRKWKFQLTNKKSYLKPSAEQ